MPSKKSKSHSLSKPKDLGPRSLETKSISSNCTLKKRNKKSSEKKRSKNYSYNKEQRRRKHRHREQRSSTQSLTWSKRMLM